MSIAEPADCLPLRSSEQTAAVSLRGLSKTFGDSKVVDDLSLCLPAGEFLGLIGANGAGKSTTLRMLAGLLKPTEGEADVLGVSVHKMNPPLRQRIGYVPDSLQIYRWMSVSDAISFCKRLNSHWNDATCHDLMLLFELPHRKKIAKLSKGMLAKLGLLLGISHSPELLLLDEPMSGLDPIAREEFLEGVLKVVTERECSVILSSHSIDDVQRISDSIAFLHRGKLLLHQPTHQIIETTKRIRMVVEDAARIPSIKNAVLMKREAREVAVTVNRIDANLMQQLEMHPEIQHVSVEDLTLEEIYKDYVRGMKEKM